MPEADLSLLRRFAEEGDQEAFAQIVHRHADLVYGTALRMLRDRAGAEDVAQETFFRLLRHSRSVTHSLAGWLHRTATQLAIDVIRSDSARRAREAGHQVERGGAADAELTWAQVSPHVDEALLAMPEDARALLVEHFLHGRSQRDLAVQRGISPATLCRQMQTALDQLRHQLRKRGVVVSAVLLASLFSASIAQAAPASLIMQLGKITLISGSPVIPGQTFTPHWPRVTISRSGWFQITCGAVAGCMIFGFLLIAALPSPARPGADTGPAAMPSPANSARMIVVCTLAIDHLDSRAIAMFHPSPSGNGYAVVHGDGHTVTMDAHQLDAALRRQTGKTLGDFLNPPAGTP
ncbi:MAG: sigma-70 family RNA polymerase sigma factor [Phycisphaeraceae bacterium]|nr:sigma-70 family RNA polymerase sigma factor [Phycisphaeraceae bacterium]